MAYPTVSEISTPSAPRSRPNWQTSSRIIAASRDLRSSTSARAFRIARLDTACMSTSAGSGIWRPFSHS
jgi:hypothetical protein